MRKILLSILVLAMALACVEVPQEPTPAPVPDPEPEPEKPIVDPTPTDPIDEPDTLELIPQDVSLMASFTEQFEAMESEYFSYAYRTGFDDFRYYPNFPSLSEQRTRIMMLRIDPMDSEGINYGPRIISNEHALYGRYTIRVRIPDSKKAQPKIGAVVSLSNMISDESFGDSQIAFEWRLASPEVVYLFANTGVAPQNNTIQRTINLATGTIISTEYKSLKITDGRKEVLSGGKLSSKPETVAAIKNFNAAKRFYTYGFDWYPDRITWWIVDPATKEETVLWNYEAEELFPKSPEKAGIPLIPGVLRADFYYSKNKLAEQVSNSTQAPKYPFELEIDSISYEPYDELNQAWHDKYFSE